MEGKEKDLDKVGAASQCFIIAWNINAIIYIITHLQCSINKLLLINFSKALFFMFIIYLFTLFCCCCTFESY